MRSGRRGLAVLLSGVAYIPSIAAAQDTAATQAQELDAIVVTAQRRTELLNEVPLSITAVTGKNLEKLGVKDTADLAKIVPGFTFAQSSSNAPIYTLRGVGMNDSTLSAGPTVAVYVDEIPLPFGVMTRGAGFDLQRVEVLKGPQGTLYGLNSTGGAINYISAKPTKTLEAGGSISYSRFANVDVQGHVSGPISDTLSYRISAQTTHGGDWQRSSTRDASLGQSAFYQGRAQLAWEPSSTVRFMAMANAWQDRSDTQAAQLNAILPQNPQNVAATAAVLAQPITVGRSNRVADWDPGVDYRNDNRFYQFALRSEADLAPETTLTAITSYSNYRQRENRDIDGTSRRILLVTPDGDVKSFSQELRLTGRSGPVKWIVGGNYSRDVGKEFQRYAISQQTNNAPVGFPLTFADLATDTRARTYATFANADLEVSPTVTLTGGVRYTHSSRTFVGCMRDAGDGALAGTAAVIQSIAKGAFGLPPGPTPMPGGCATLNDNFDAGLTNDRLSEENVSWRTGVKYAPSRHLMVYANVSRGYKSGQFPTILASRSLSFQPVTQEKLTSYEVGTKFSMADRRVDVSAAAFYYDYRDKQVRGRYLDPVFFTLEKLANVPKSDVYGGEVQVSVRPVRGLTINLAGSYTDANIREFKGIDQRGASVDFADTQMPFTSKWQGVADADYRMPVGEQGEAFVGSTLTYAGTSNAFLGGDPVGRLKARTLLDLRAGYGARDGAWQIYAWGRNVTDAKYQNFVSRITDTVIGYAGRPATYGVTLTTQFR